jgi:hypothetical protein
MRIPQLRKVSKEAIADTILVLASRYPFLLLVCVENHKMGFLRAAVWVHQFGLRSKFGV